MAVPRRALLGATLLALAGCASDPRVRVAPGATPRVHRAGPPAQLAPLTDLAGRLAGVREHVAAATADAWRTAALAQLDDQLARLDSANPFATPDPVFEPRVVTSPALAAAVAAVVTHVEEAAGELDDPGLRLLVLACGASTKGLANRGAVPAEGGEPGPVDALSGGRLAALGHVWALLHGMQVGLGRLGRDDPLRTAIAERVPAAKELRDALRAGVTAPSQPASFQLPTPMRTQAEIRSGWATLESNLLEGLVLLAAEDPTQQHWQEQVGAVHDAGGRVQRWPGWA